MRISKPNSVQFTYADYLSWNDKKRWEIIDGMAYEMSPSPNTEHQRISMLLSVVIGNFLNDKISFVFAAPLDVRLAEKNQEEINNVVQPDLVVLCERAKIDEQGIVGAPDWIIEITSPSTIKHDFGTKLLLYQKFRIREYWIIDPEVKAIHVFKIDISGKYNPGQIYKGDDIIAVSVFQDFTITPKEIFLA